MAPEPVESRKKEPLLAKRDALVLGLVIAIAGLILLAPWFWRLGRLAYHQHKLLSAENESHAAYHASHLNDMGRRGGPSLLKALKMGKLHARRMAARCLSISLDDGEQPVLAALKRAATRDPDRSVRVEAGSSLCLRGAYIEGLPCAAEALAASPEEPDYATKRWLAKKFRIREAVEALISDLESPQGFKTTKVLDSLYYVAEADIGTLPELRRWEQEWSLSKLTEQRKKAILTEIQAWWEKRKDEFRSLQDVLDGKVPLIAETE